MKVLWLANVPSPYRVDFFNELGKKCDLTVLFEKNTSDERDESWRNYSFQRFDGRILKGVVYNTDSAFCPSVLKYLKKDVYDYIVVTTFTSLTGMLAIEYMRAMKISYWIESDGGFAKDGIGLKEKIKKHFISGAGLYLSTGKSHKRYYHKYGAPIDKIEEYPFSSYYDCDVLQNLPTRRDKEQMRKKLDIKEKKVILAVGQFINRKGFDVLLDAARIIDDTVGVYFVGGMPTEDYVQFVNHYKLKNVHFIGFKTKKDLNNYYIGADIFVLPTREDIWGLVIAEAFAKGLPVISTSNCGAAIQLIDNWNNGVVVSSEDRNVLASILSSVLNNEDQLKTMSKNALMKAHDYTIEKMVDRHVDLFEKYRL